MKRWQGESCWLHPRKSDPEEGPNGVIASATVATWFSLAFVWSQQIYQGLLKAVKFFDSS